jgi:hypothetical protein
MPAATVAHATSSNRQARIITPAGRPRALCTLPNLRIEGIPGGWRVKEAWEILNSRKQQRRLYRNNAETTKQ